MVSVEGQFSNEPLLSSEMFGYGGQSFGRAYDPSEITGDNGIVGLFELRYSDLPSYLGFTWQPYAFYDIGKVWEIDGEDSSGSSAGIGLRFLHENGVSGTLALAEPLTRKQSDPQNGNGKNPRLLFSLSHTF